MEVTVSIAPAPLEQLGMSPGEADPNVTQQVAGNHMVTKVALRQAEERTRLVVECAGLVRRMEELDKEMVLYNDWQKYPSLEYQKRVQQRFDEARRREAAEANRRGLASPSSPSSPSSLSAKDREVSAAGGEEDRKLAVTHLSKALTAAEFEASVWRQRAFEMAQEDEREREKARRLLEFELNTALKQAEGHKEQLAQKLREQDDAMERLEAELRAANAARESSAASLDSAQRRADSHKADSELHRSKADKLMLTVAEKDQEIAAARDETRAVQADCEAKLRKLSEAVAQAEANASSEMEAARAGANAVRQELAESQAHVLRLTQDMAGVNLELKKARAAEEVSKRELAETRSEAEARCKRLSADVSAMQLEVQRARDEGSTALKAMQESRDESEARCGRLSNDLANIHSELQRTRASEEARCQTLTMELSRAKAELGRVRSETDVARAELQQARDDGEARCQRAVKELAVVRDRLQQADDRAKEQQSAIDRLQAELPKLQADRDAKAKDIDAKQGDIQKLTSAVASRDTQIVAARRELCATLKGSDRVQQVGVEKVLSDVVAAACTEMATLRERLDRAQQDCEAHVARVDRLQGDAEAKEEQIAAAQRGLHRATADNESNRTLMSKQKHDLATVAEERDHHEKAAFSALRKAELLSAQVTNLEAALNNSNNKQADLALEKERERQKVEKLERALAAERSGMGPLMPAAALSLTSTDVPLSPSSGGKPHFSAMADTPEPLSPGGASVLSARGPLPPVRRPGSARPKERLSLGADVRVSLETQS